jgi:replicative DNA helicase
VTKRRPRSDSATEPPAHDDALDARTLPHNLEAERSVLGAILVHHAAYEIAEPIVRPEDFYRDAHRRIFSALTTLINRNIAPDFVTLKEELARLGELDEVGGPAYIAGLADGIPRATNVTYYAGIVREKAALRRIIYAANKVLIDAYAAEEPSEDIVSNAERALVDVAAGTRDSQQKSLKDTTNERFTAIEWRHQHKGQLRGIDSGYDSINDLTLGWRGGDLVIIAARTSIGKTTFTTNTAVHAALKGKRVATFSLEMTREQLEDRILSSLSGVDCSRIQSGVLGERDFTRLAPALEEMARMDFIINDRAGQTIIDIRRACRRIRSEGGLDLVVIDYVQLVPGSTNRRGATRTEEVTDIANRAKELAREMNVPVFLLSQLKRTEGRPRVDDLRESGGLEQAADLVGLLHRKDARASGPTEFIMGKQRNGPTGAVWLTIARDTLTFTDGGGPAPGTPQEPEKPRKKAFYGKRKRGELLDEEVPRDWTESSVE